ncbi:phosphoadenylyl-sulfate reductase [Meiothermus rufus]|uniref:phosphoadenylyl-sulfate reductase n=1 Tax=Meiothermus rufus TaxID=604332 RepID=UPI0003F604A5|nr:phosphoadenylyl-sulfate reductase [Meiothermus rufus]
MNWKAETDPRVVIAWALEHYPGLLMTSAFNLNGVVLLELAAQAGYRGEVVFVDTGYHFPETLQTRDRLQERYPQMHFVTLKANLPEEAWGKERYRTDPDGCCAARKVAPLRAYLAQKNPPALLNARSRDQAKTRAHLGFLEPGERLRINPLAFWDRPALEAFAKAHNLPVNPLYWSGFFSIGCWPCTRAVRPGEEVRAGRWAGRGKTECGLWEGDQAL